MTEATRTVREESGPPAPGWLRGALLVAGPGLLIASGAIHLDLYLTGYRTIPTIGTLFLLQVIAAFGLGLAVLALRSRLAAAAAAGFSLSTLGGYLLSVWIGLFGFKEVRTTAGIVAGILEVAAFAALAAFVLAPAPAASTAKGPARALPQLPGATARAAGMATAGLAVVALALLGVSLAGAGGSGPATAAAGGRFKTATIGGATVLSNAKGLTLYSFAPDTATKSTCYGSCAAYWPPVTGSAPASSVPGTFATIKRSDGSSQVTYNGHPLYTYVGDTTPGQAFGNGLNLNGGLWHEVSLPG